MKIYIYNIYNIHIGKDTFLKIKDLIKDKHKINYAF